VCLIFAYRLIETSYWNVKTSKPCLRYLITVSWYFYNERREKSRVIGNHYINFHITSWCTLRAMYITFLQRKKIMLNSKFREIFAYLIYLLSYVLCIVCMMFTRFSSGRLWITLMNSLKYIVRDYFVLSLRVLCVWCVRIWIKPTAQCLFIRTKLIIAIKFHHLSEFNINISV